MSTKFSEHTRRLLANRPYHLSLAQIGRETGLQVNWMKYFIRTGGGSADNIESLYVYLTGEAPQLLPLHPKFMKD